MQISRRQILKRLAAVPGAAAISPLLLPSWERLRAEQRGEVGKRFVFVVKSSGLTPAELVPQEMTEERVIVGEASQPGDSYRQALSLRTTNTLIDRSLARLNLHESLRALEPFQDRMAIVQGLSGRMCKGGHSSWFGAMGCYRTGGEHDWGNIIGPTIDGVLAKHLPGIFPHVGLTTGGKIMGGKPLEDGVVYPGISAIARNRQLPYQATPLDAYRELFSVAATSEEDLLENRLQGTLLDFMVDDIKHLESQLGAQEREKLDVYLDGFESLRHRRRRLQGVEAQVRKHAPTVDDKYTSSSITDRLEAHFDLAAAALIAGLTNVITLRPDRLMTMYTPLGADKSVHGLGHGEGGDPIVNRRNIRQFHCEQIARLAAKLDAVPEGSGTMLDNTVIVYFSDAGEKHHASGSQWPFVLVGGISEQLRLAGRYLQYPSYGVDGHRTIANLYNTLSHAAGRPQDRFGQLDARLSESSQLGPLPELLPASA